MAVITAAVLTALNTGFKVQYQAGYDAMAPQSLYAKIAMEVSSQDASETYGWLGDMPEMREWIGDRVLKDIKQTGYQIVNKDFEATVSVHRNAIEDDKLGVMNPRFRLLGEQAALYPDVLTFGLMKAGRTTLCYDGQYYFDTDHPSFDATGAAVTVSNVDASGGANPFWYLLDTRSVLKPLIFQSRKKPQLISKESAETSDTVFMKNQYVYGVDMRCNVGFGFWHMAYASNLPLTAANFEAARVIMQSRRRADGRPLNIEPNMIVCGTGLRAAADRLFNAMTDANGASNPNYKAVETLVTPWVN